MGLLDDTPTPRALRWLTARRDASIAAIQRAGLRRGAQMAATWLGEPDSPHAELLAWHERTIEHALRRICRDGAIDDATPLPGDLTPEDLPASLDVPLPAPASTDAMQAARTFIAAMPPVTRQKLCDALALFEAGATLFGPQARRRRFTQMDPWAQDAYLTQWSDSEIEARRAIFQAIKSVCVLGYWSQPACWPAIDYHLDTERSLPRAMPHSPPDATTP